MSQPCRIASRKDLWVEARRCSQNGLALKAWTGSFHLTMVLQSKPIVVGCYAILQHLLGLLRFPAFCSTFGSAMCRIYLLAQFIAADIAVSGRLLDLCMLLVRVSLPL
eukprot:TRINITY_DN80696_c0_g1_i1.p1 TRINITY_DN80696_c0_g1~~TRINITY_DN80696_c0_g1_i1.p1  ORF type:complete len:108 (-),score=8.78 TRINITY_DN80696_c0_g1_i1:53-376(-)